MKGLLNNFKKHQKLILFIIISSITAISLIIGSILLGVGVKEYNEQVSLVKDNFELKDLMKLAEEKNFQLEDNLIPEKWKGIITGSGDELKLSIEKALEKTIDKINTPLFSYGMFLMVMGLISGIGVGLYGNSIFNKKYQSI